LGCCTCRIVERECFAGEGGFHPSAQAAVAKLRELKAPVLACGQTVFWDEPVKIALREILDAFAPEIPMWLGVHDSDYFSRGVTLQDGKGCAALSHNDGSTRGIWAAAGELSVLFGGEVVPTQEDLAGAGVSLEKAARAARMERDQFLNSVTEAWGWKGLVCLGSEHPVAAHISLAQLRRPLSDLLRWGFETSSSFLGSEDARVRARQVGESILGWLDDARDAREQPPLTRFYQELIPRFCSLLLGREPENLVLFSSSEFFRFDATTAERPRFALLSLFLNGKTAGSARMAYDDAVKGSGIYELDKFGGGAIPFDVVVRGKGRGTIFVSEREIRVGFESGLVVIPISEPVEEAKALAVVLETALGKGISLVGKALVLPLMFSAEFVMVLHQEASVYLPLTRKMCRLMRRAGLELALHPILRLRYHTWSSLSGVEASFHLPAHLAAAFQKEKVSAAEFAATWEEVVARQGPFLAHLRELKPPEELLAYLSTRDVAWKAKAEEWSGAHRTLHETGEWVKCYRMTADELTATIAGLNSEIAELERRKGELRRQVSLTDSPLLAAQPPSGGLIVSEEEADGRREELTAEIRSRRASIRQKKATFKQVMVALRRTEAEEQAVKARETITRVEAEAELARAYLARDALLVQGLTRSNHRPTAWWFPLVDAENRWFKQVVRSAELFFEEFDGE